jgi:succinyl-CoA synthetase alpha subunit
MSIIVGEDTKLVVSGLTGREGSFHGLRNRSYGTHLRPGSTQPQRRFERRLDPTRTGSRLSRR